MMVPYMTQLQKLIAEEVSKVRGISYPVHAGRLERALVRKVNCRKLHPNPYDEFCFPEIGPNEGILSRYEKHFRKVRNDPEASLFLKSGIREPLDIQKIYPDGYMILNGHHRWLAALRTGVRKLPVRIVNLTQEKDLRIMLQNAKHDKRVVLDLEETVFSSDSDGKTERPLRFPANRIYRERLRLGIPALFSFFASRGYDIWLYSSGNDSLDYIRELLRHYHVRVTGIVTGTGRKAPKDTKTPEELEKRMAQKYTLTVHVDPETLLMIDSRNGTFREFSLSGAAVWTAKIMEVIDGVKADA